MAFARDVLGHYTLTGAQTEEEILAAAEDILARRLERMGSLGNPRDTEDFLRYRLAGLDHEQFHAVWLDNRHRILGVEKLFNGTIDGASVHPREVVKAGLRINASAVIFSHNHPSGLPQPSAADKAITHQLRDALALVDIRVLDHLVVATSGCVSMAARGLM
jgi:DNA repair protein RadC